MASTNKKGILERLSEGVVLGDGGYLLELEKRGRVRAGPFTPEVALNNPESLLELHREFRDAGAEVLQALTFYASRDKLATVGMGDRVEELNRAAVRIAKQAAGDRCLVAGNLSLTWMYEPNDKAAADRVRKTFDEQLDVQVAEGVDFIIGETFSFLGEALLAVERAKKTKLPVMVTVCFENEDITTGRQNGSRSRPRASRRRRGRRRHQLPAQSRTHAAADGRNAQSRAAATSACQPVAYRTTHTHRDFTSLPAFPDQLEPYQLTRREMAEYAVKARELGINYIGACCGAVATHIREMARALGKLPADERVWKKGGEKPMSAYEYYGHDQKAKAGS